MITVTATEKSNKLFLVETSEKVKGKMQFKDDVTMAEASRLHYFWTREFILEKMNSFLKQRKKAYELVGHAKMYRSAETILSRIDQRRYASLNSICMLIKSMEGDIMLVAPGDHSAHYHYYST